MKTANNNQRAARMTNNNLKTRGDIVFCECQSKAKTLFHNRAEAEALANLENSTRPADRQLVPYYCKSCGGWHLGVRRHYNDSGLLGTNSVLSSRATESTQWRQYQCGNRHTGHGFAAEDANALADRRRGHSVQKTGWDNAPDGPDRIVDGVRIQTKYCQSARASVNSAFDKQTGMYRYSGQQLEVPKDQYAEAVKVMEEKIREGKVDGVTNPTQAKNLVRKGHYTYDQSVKIAKAGNWESVKFDIRNQAGASATAGAISAAVTFVSAKHQGTTTREAFKASGIQAGKTAGKTMVTGVATQQFLRTSAGRATTAVLQKSANKAIDAAIRTGVGRKVVEKTAEGVGKRALAGAAARNVLSRTASTNVITATTAFVVSAIPDTIKLCTGKISGKEYGERTACNGAGAVGGTGGAWVGAAIGSCICPGIGTAIGGFVGGIAGGIGASAGVSKLFHRKSA